jgi:hypothetical protein
MNQVYSEFMAAAGDDSEEIPFDDLPAYTGTEWWRGGDPSPPANAGFTDGAVYPNAPYGASFAAEFPNPSGVNYRPHGGRSPYGTAYEGTQYGSEMSDQMQLAIDNDPYAIGQNLGLMNDYSDWSDDVNEGVL